MKSGSPPHLNSSIIVSLLAAGLYTSPTHNESLCESENFLERTWVTQGRQDVTETTPYPIVGEYSGVIPDTDGLCAKAYSDCNNPEIMFYTIFNCFNRSEVYEGEEAIRDMFYRSPNGNLSRGIN